MKKIIYTLGILAASAFAFSACQKEQTIKEELPGESLITVSFTAEKAGTDTKTAAVEGSASEGVSYIWTDDDVNNMKLFIVGEDGEGKETLTAVANTTVTKVSDTKLTISGKVAPNATYTFRAVLSGSWTTDGKKARVSEIQHPSASNFDPSADVLVSDDKEVTVGASSEETIATDALEMSFRRLVVVNKMTLKNLTEGDNISKIVITSTKNLAGYFATDTRTANGDKKTLTLNYTSATVPTGGQFPVYFTTIPETGHVLTVEVTTDQFIYTKSFAEGKSINFNIGQFTKFNFALPAGVANTALTLPVVDDMAWATTGGADDTSEMSTSDLTPTQGTKKIYDSATKAYKGGDGIKLGSSSVNGSITTNSIDLSSAFYVAIDAKSFGTDVSQLKIQVDGSDVYTSPDNLTSSYETYYVNCSAATATSNVTIKITGKRGYINNLVIGAGTYVAPPKINVTSSNPLEVANTASSQTITYTIDNPKTGESLTASTEATWIKNINCATAGSVTFDVEAQEAAAASREGTITLAYTGAKPVNVTVSQAAGAGGTSTYAYTFTSKSWTATLEGNSANWESGQDGGGFSNGGIQVTATYSGANGTSPYSFTDVEEIVVTYCTNASKGAGSIKVTVGTGATQTFTVSAPSSGGTTAKTTSFTYSPKESGKVNIEVTCSTNSIYLIGASIKAKSINTPVFYAITCATGIANGSISADKATASEGDEVTLTATPASGYKLDSWTVTEATSGDPVAVTGNKFNMPADAVNVSATFVKDTGYTSVAQQTFTFSELGYANGAAVSSIDGTSHCSIVFSNAKYYTSGSALRVYSGSTATITAASGYKITSISIAFGSSDGSNEITVDKGTYSNGSWTGEISNGESVVFSIGGSSGNRRFSSITIN